ncbi:hypothetical protein OG365_24195 [Streptomyces sp. NBC_00853]|uniref:hypothetical protein n=1 Tax=Streptomyces sp. NBC_00853 TaxID=2903681 RepID=UPI003873580D|nr:hypothetical protein OG365_24195 [Streptomyces sp. NBC_00853]
MAPDADISLASKLALLLRRKIARTGQRPSVRTLERATAATPGGKPAMTHQVINDLLNDEKRDPKTSQLLGLARAFDAPVAFFLPRYNGLTSLEVYEASADAREALRLIHDLGDDGAAELLEAAREIRRRHGKTDTNIPEVPELPPTVEPPRPGRRRRLSFTEAADRAVSDLEGL